MIATNIIHAAYKYGTTKLLNLGSSCIYPKHAPQPLKEESLLTGPLEPTNEPYAIAKITAIKLCQYYNEQYQTNFISVMPTNLYGPHDNFDLETAHVLPTLLRKFHLANLLKQGDFEGIQRDLEQYPVGKSFLHPQTELDIVELLKAYGITKDAVALWGTGTPYREFLYVDDLAHACMFAMQNFDHTQLDPFVNIGTSCDITIKDLALLIQKIVGFDGDITFDATKPDGTPKKQLDVTRIESLGWQHKITLQQGIENAYRWYQEKQIISHNARRACREAQVDPLNHQKLLLKLGVTTKAI